MSVSVTVDDPNAMICTVHIVIETPDVVIASIDMNSSGKRATNFQGGFSPSWMSDLDRGDFVCTIHFHDMPFEAENCIDNCGDCSKYEAWCMFIRRDVMVKAIEADTCAYWRKD